MSVSETFAGLSQKNESLCRKLQPAIFRFEDPSQALNCYNSTFNVMADKIFIFISHVLDVTFFAGLVGCVLMIALSWVDIFTDSFSDDD